MHGHHRGGHRPLCARAFWPPSVLTVLARLVPPVRSRLSLGNTQITLDFALLVAMDADAALFEMLK